ncbi:glycosyltransferase [Candidatus Dependentiae bacterium]|nr:glycosyltransferase [Candidatus Dependentiae bacterium]
MIQYTKFKNCLYLYEFDFEYILFHINETKKYFDNTCQINYSDYFKKFGPISLENKIFETVEQNKIDLILIFIFDNNFEISPRFLNSLRKNCRIVFWLFDEEFLQQTFTKYYSQTADAVIVTDYLGRAYYEKLDIPTVLYFSSYSKKEYHPVAVKKEYDVTFIGEVRDERLKYINFLKKNGIKVDVFGRGSENGPVSMEQMNLIFNKSKINLNFTAIQVIPWIEKFDPVTINRAKQNKGRPIEIALTKSFCLSEYAPTLKYVFEIGNEVDYFKDCDELLEKVRKYLEDDRKREIIAENAYKRAITEYESEIYIKNVIIDLFEKLEKNIQSKKTIEIFESDYFKKRRLFFFARFIRRTLKKYRIGLAVQTFKYLLRNGYTGFDIFKTLVLDLFKIKV